MTNQKKELDLYFEYRCRKGMEWRGLAGKEEYEKRLEHELDVICSMDFAGYFLIVCDLLDWCRKNDIPTGTGRGSAGGSLATFCLNITQLDPLRYGLIFERFLDYTRTDSYPDIDLDFGELERHLVFNHIVEKFGADCVAGIGTYGKMKTKGAIRAMCRTLGYPYDMGDELAKLVLPPIAGKEQKLKVCYEKVSELAAAKKGESGPEKKAILEAAEWMEDRLQTFGTHASGVVISDFPVSECVPLGRGKDNSPVAQVDMNDLEEVGLIKFDILGLRALSTIKKCLDIIEERHGEKLNPLDFPVDDPETYDLMCSGDVLGVFQLTCSQGFQSLTTQIQPRNIDDGSMLVAIYRPGPMSMGLHQQIIDVRNGVSEPEYFLPELEPILKDTAGLVVFQEQLMAIGKDLAGYDAAATNRLRKATAKKKKKMMDEQHEKFVGGMVANGFQQSKAEELFQSLVDFSSYSFNRSHSSLYFYISFQTAYLKAHYPLEYICACLISEGDEPEEIYKYLSWCQKHNIKILPPDINQSQETFSISKDGKGIHFGLGVIKNVSVVKMKGVVEARDKDGPFRDIFDFCDRYPDINRRMLVSLIQAGAFDSLHSNRQSVIDGVEDIWRYRTDIKAYQRKLRTYEEKTEKWRERERQKAAGAKLPSLKKPEQPSKPKAPVLMESLYVPPLIEQYEVEMDLLGYYLSGHPVELVADRPNRVVSSIEEMKEHAKDGDKVSVLAVPAIITETTTRKTKQKMAYITVEDGTDTLDITVFAKTWAKHKSKIKKGRPAVFVMNLEVLSSKKEDDTDDTIGDRVVKGKAFTVNEVQLKTDPNSRRGAPEFNTSIDFLYKKRRQLKKLTKEGEMEVKLRITTKTGADIIFITKTNNLPLFQRLFI